MAGKYKVTSKDEFGSTYETSGNSRKEAGRSMAYYKSSGMVPKGPTSGSPSRSDDRRKSANNEGLYPSHVLGVPNAESRTKNFSGGYFAQKESQEHRAASRDENISRGKTLDYERKWGKP